MTATTFLIVLALLPNSNVLFVSGSLKEAGEAQMTTVVLALPPRDSCKILRVYYSVILSYCYAHSHLGNPFLRATPTFQSLPT